MTHISIPNCCLHSSWWKPHAIWKYIVLVFVLWLVKTSWHIHINLEMLFALWLVKAPCHMQVYCTAVCSFVYGWWKTYDTHKYVALLFALWLVKALRHTQVCGIADYILAGESSNTHARISRPALRFLPTASTSITWCVTSDNCVCLLLEFQSKPLLKQGHFKIIEVWLFIKQESYLLCCSHTSAYYMHSLTKHLPTTLTSTNTQVRAHTHTLINNK